MHSVSHRSWIILATAAALIAALVLVLVTWNNKQAVQARHDAAEALLARFDADTGISLEEYAALKQLTASEPDVRLEAARLFQDEAYVRTLNASGEFIARAIVGGDYDGTLSRELAEQLFCAPLEHAPATANADLPFYLVPALNPVALDSAYCATILTERLITADPGSFAQGANLLALVLAQLPPGQAASHIAVLVGQMALAPPAGVDELANALHHVRSAVYPAEFGSALQTLAARITSASTPVEVAVLFDSIDFLKHSVTAEELTPVLDAAIGQMLDRNDHGLNREVYFTLSDLEESHPEASFGRRADYLMRGINLYSDSREIYDYSNVLRLDERYPGPGQEAALAAALLDAIRNLQDYRSAIWPHCQRFLELSGALEYEDFLEGARLLVAQINNAEFLFQRPCLLDSDLVEKIAVPDRAALAVLILDALPDTYQPGLADRIELLGKLGNELNDAQTRRLADLIRSAAQGATGINPVFTFGPVRAALAANIDFPPEFYSELFVLIVNSDASNGRGPLLVFPQGLLDKLPEAQRKYIVATALAALAPQQMEPESLAAQAELLVALRVWLTPQEAGQVSGLLLKALEDTRNGAVFDRLTYALNLIKPQRNKDEQATIQTAWLQLVAAGTQRDELVPLFEVGRLAGGLADATGREAVHAAVLRFLMQIVPGDKGGGIVRPLLAQPADGPAQIAMQQRARNNSRITLEPDDIAAVSARYVNALVNERVSQPVANFAVSIDTLASRSRPGELTALLDALQGRLDDSADPATHDLLVYSWITVEKATNAKLPADQRLPLYAGVAQLPLTSTVSRALLLEQAGTIAQHKFADAWSLPIVAHGDAPAR